VHCGLLDAVWWTARCDPRHPQRRSCCRRTGTAMCVNPGNRGQPWARAQTGPEVAARRPLGGRICELRSGALVEPHDVPDRERKLKLQTHLGVAQAAPDQLLNAAQPIANGVRVHDQGLGGRGR
jgi:hypothetical protein